MGDGRHGTSVYLQVLRSLASPPSSFHPQDFCNLSAVLFFWGGVLGLYLVWMSREKGDSPIFPSPPAAMLTHQTWPLWG